MGCKNLYPFLFVLHFPMLNPQPCHILANHLPARQIVPYCMLWCTVQPGAGAELCCACLPPHEDDAIICDPLDVFNCQVVPSMLLACKKHSNSYQRWSWSWLPVLVLGSHLSLIEHQVSMTQKTAPD